MDDVSSLLRRALALQKDMNSGKTRLSTSPKYKLLKENVREFVADNYSPGTKKALNSTIAWNRIAHGSAEAEAFTIASLGRMIEFLEELKRRPTKEEGKPLVITAKTDPINNLHPVIVQKCSKLYSEGNYEQAVEKAFKIVRDRLRTLTNYETGSDAFGRGHLYIRGSASPNVDDDFQRAVKFLTMSIDFFRNEKAHTSDGNLDEGYRALEYLSIASLAMRHLDNAEITT